jgi:NitT/TauT family transport system permease protein
MNTHPFITPNAEIPESHAQAIIFGWIALWLVSWFILRPVVLPSPIDVLNEFPRLWNQEGLGQELISSFTVNAEALLLSTLVSLPLAYLSRVPIVWPLAAAVAKLRFLSPAVFFVLLLFVVGTGHGVKVAMLTMGETFFLVTTMVGVVQSIDPLFFDDARTLRMSEWLVTWFVVVRGTLGVAINAVRDNAAMGWSSITFVEGFVRSEGGVGVLILDQERHMNFGAVAAVAVAVLAVGLLQDAFLSWLRRTVCVWEY